MDDEEILKANREANLALYSEYNKTLRSWLVAYGIAVPALFVTSKDAKEFLLQSCNFKFIIITFLFGVFAQILISFINKFVSWCAYHRDDCKLRKDVPCKPYFSWVAKLENSIWIDVTLDVLTLFFFAMSTYMLLNIG